MQTGMQADSLSVCLSGYASMITKPLLWSNSSSQAAQKAVKQSHRLWGGGKSRLHADMSATT